MRKLNHVVAWIALFFAMTGTGLAASHYVITSKSQIKPSVLRKLHGREGPPGSEGPQGATGATGAPGPSNLSALTVVEGPIEMVPSGAAGGSIAYCPPGTRVVSGGGNGSIAGLADSQTSTGREGWFILVSNGTSIAVPVRAQALCAGTGQAVAASAPQGAKLRQAMADAKGRLERRLP